MLLYKHNDDSISEIKIRLLVSAPAGPGESGGLFNLDFSANACNQINDFDCRGLINFHSGYLLATRDAIIKYDREVKEVARYGIGDLDIHGLQVSADGTVLIAETARNRIGLYEADSLTRFGEIAVTSHADDHNHVNDIEVVGDSLLISMFTLEGNWHDKGPGERWDGCIAEYSMSTKNLIRVLFRDLQLPHSLLTTTEGLYYCESIGLRVCRDGKEFCTFFGYTRGLAQFGKHLFVGQSRMRHREENRVPHASLDAGVHVFDLKKRLSRFIPIPATQVYSIVPVTG